MVNLKYYTGITQDINIRMSVHNKGYSKSTRYYRPLKLIFLTIATDRKTARKLEVKIKSRTAKKFLIDQRHKLHRPYQNILNTETTQTLLRKKQPK